MANKFLAITFALTFAGRLFSQDIPAEDYLLYSKIIQKETNPAAKSICIIKREVESMKYHKYDAMSPLDWQEIKRKNEKPTFLLFNQARDSMDNPQRIFDDTIKRFIDNYYEMHHSKFVLRNSFTLPYKSFLLKKIPVKSKSVSDNWKAFYEKYPGSGGIFAFSSISYSEDRRLAVFYCIVKRNGLNGHGEIVIMQKANDTWNIFSRINLWYN